MMGTGGQNIFVSPRHNLLIATHSYPYPDEIDQYSNVLFLNIWNYVIPIFKLGDLNADAIINIFDIIQLSDSISDLNDYNEESDINNDDVIDDADINILITSLLNI